MRDAARLELTEGLAGTAGTVCVGCTAFGVGTVLVALGDTETHDGGPELARQLGTRQRQSNDYDELDGQLLTFSVFTFLLGGQRCGSSIMNGGRRPLTVLRI